MPILAELTPNNQVRIKSFRVQEGFGKGKKKETASEKEEAHYAAMVANLEGMQKVHEFYSSERTVLSNTSVPIEPYWATQVDLSPNGKEIISVTREHSSDLRERAVPLLDILKKSQQTNKKKRPWGKIQREKQFRRAGGEKILWGGAIIDKFVPKEDCRMLTLTLPGGTDEAKSCVSRWSGYIVNRLLQVTRRWQYDEPLYWFFVWEHQKRDALHLHFCMGAKGRGQEVDFLAEDVAEKWFQVLLEFKSKENIDCFARKGFQGTWRGNPSKWQWDCQPIEKSVAAYFAKYCQKNAKITKSPTPWSLHRPPRFFPSRYWGSSKTVKDAVKVFHRKKRFPCTQGASLEDVFEVLFNEVLPQSAIVKTWKYDFQVEIAEGQLVVASGSVWGFAFAPEQFMGIWSRFLLWLEERDPSSTGIRELDVTLHGCTDGYVSMQ